VFVFYDYSINRAICDLWQWQTRRKYQKGNIELHTAFFKIKISSDLCPEISVIGICVLELSILPLSTIFLLDFGTVSTAWYLLFFIGIVLL
jgi:hypothetical protein